MKILSNPLYTFIIAIISWIVFLWFILPEPFNLSDVGAYAVFTMGVFPVLLIITIIQMVKHKFRNIFGWLTILACLLAELLLLMNIYSDTCCPNGIPDWTCWACIWRNLF